MASEKFKDEWSVELKEILLKFGHPWCDRRIRELDIIPDEFMAGLPEGEKTNGEIIPEGREADNPAESTGDYPEKEVAAPESPAEQEQEDAFLDETEIPQIPEEQTDNTDAPGEKPETDGE